MNVHIPTDWIVNPKPNTTLYKDRYWAVIKPGHITIYAPDDRFMHKPLCGLTREEVLQIPGAIGFVYLPNAYIPIQEQMI